MDERDKKTELLVGLFLFVGILLLGILILQFGSIRELFRGTYDLKVSFVDASGIKEGSPVMLGGARIGKVRSRPVHDETFTRLIVALEIFAGVQIPADAKFRVGTAGLMGDAFVDVKPSGQVTDKFLGSTQKDVIKGEKGSDIADLSKTAGQIGDQVKGLLEEDVRPAMAEVKQAVEKVNKGVLSNENVDHVKKGLARLESSLQRLDEKIVTDENAESVRTTLASLKDAGASLKKTAATFDEQAGRLGPMMDKVDGALTKVGKTLDSLDESLQVAKKGVESFAGTMKMMNTGDGAFKAFMTDAQLKNDLKEAIREFKEFSRNVKETGIFRYKDLEDSGEGGQRSAPEGSSSQPPRTLSPLKRPGGR